METAFFFEVHDFCVLVNQFEFNHIQSPGIKEKMEGGNSSKQMRNTIPFKLTPYPILEFMSDFIHFNRIHFNCHQI